MAKKPKITTNNSNMVLLLSNEDLSAQFGEAYASEVMKNPAVTWAKFILTDDKPNGNMQRVPLEEFANLINSGLYMPIKMSEGEIAPGHEGADPLGTIAHLKVDGDKILALAALWTAERPADVEYIRSLVNSGEDVNISWEILFGDYSMSDQGIMELRDVALKAATIVKNPAYRGRTPILAVAAKKWSKAYIEGLTNDSFLLIDIDGNRHFPYRDDAGIVDPSRFQQILEEVTASSLDEDTKAAVRQQVRSLKELSDGGEDLRTLSVAQIVFGLNEEVITEDNNVEELETLKNELASLKDALASKDTELAGVSEELSTLRASKAEYEAAMSELASLREFKAQIDAEAEKVSKIGAIKTRFEEAGISKPDDYFLTNAEHLLGLDESGLNFLIQELVSFSQSSTVVVEGTQASSSIAIPNLPTTGSSKKDISELAKALKALRK